MSHLAPTLYLALFAGLAVAPAAAQRTIGMVADRTNNIVVFDADTDTVIATIAVPGDPFLPLFDCVIAKSRGRGYVADFDNQRFWIVDLDANPPVLGNNGQPVAITTYPEDLTLSPNERYLLASDGNGEGTGSPVSIIDLDTDTEIGTVYLSPTTDPTSIAMCDDGTFVATELLTPTTTNIRRYRLDRHGVATDTFQVLPDAAAPDINNLVVTSRDDEGHHGRRSLVGFGVSRRANQRVTSFHIDGLVPADMATLSGAFGIDMALSRNGQMLYVRGNVDAAPGPSGAGAGFVDAFRVNPESGRFRSLAFTIPLDRRTGTAFGVDQMALDPQGRKLYVAGLAQPEVRIFNARTGVQIGTLTSPGLGVPTGVAIARMPRGCGGHR